MKNINYLAHSDFVYRHTSVPIFVHCEWAIMEDVSGYKYFCAEAANGTTGLGFDNTIIQDALSKISHLPSIPSFCETHIRQKVGCRIGKLISDITGVDGKVAFELGGAQGIELAIRIAKANNKKSQFVVFEGGYHGRSAYTAQFSASHRYRAATGDWRVPIIRLPYPDYEQSGRLLSFNKWKKDYLINLDKLISREVGGLFVNKNEQDIVALVIEPILNAGGIVKPDKEIVI